MIEISVLCAFVFVVVAVWAISASNPLVGPRGPYTYVPPSHPAIQYAHGGRQKTKPDDGKCGGCEMMVPASQRTEKAVSWGTPIPGANKCDSCGTYNYLQVSTYEGKTYRTRVYWGADDLYNPYADAMDAGGMKAISAYAKFSR